MGISRVAAACLIVWSLAASPSLAQAVDAARISARDQVKVSVFNDADLSRQYPVDGEGFVDFPMIGKVKAAGLTERQLEAEIARRLRDGQFLLNPQVTVALEMTPNKRVIVMGEVRTQGQVSYAGEITVLEAIVRAGGRTPDAGDEALVVRAARAAGAAASSGDPSLVAVNLRSIERGDRASNLVLGDGDQVFVKKAQQVFVTGHVRTPGAYNVEVGTTLRQALALAGGISDKGSDRGIRILRPAPGKDAPDEVKNVKQTSVVLPGDTIIVKARIF